MNLKKTLIISAAAVGAALFLYGCGGNDAASSTSSESDTISVGTTAGYSEDVVEFVAKQAEKQGLHVKVVSFGDYVTPDQALAQGDIDVNSFQHGPFLDAFNQKNGTDLVSIGNTYLAPLRVYSKKHKSLAELPNGASIAIPNDPSNEGRALLLLSKQGLITLKNGTDPTKATTADIATNPKNIKIVELEAPQLPRALDDCDASVINGGYAVSAKLDPKTAIATEDDTSPYINIIATRAKDKDNPTYKKFVKIFQSPETKKYIEDNYADTLVPAF
uniref:MetQ/NlpA family ABC transporter substrate-binding protein n=1 Tax=uncultured Allisonella sp. TaxID=339338 RepID=UPI00266EB88A|nr:MetQ/NlpA family ABC transporter substrate-binding protein [uncultured Allisonella sp.]